MALSNGVLAGGKNDRSGSRSGAWLLAGVVVWAIAAGSLAALLGFNDFVPGTMGTPSATWPTHTRLTLSRNSRTLIMMVHPQCPCSRASITALETVLRAAPERSRVYVLFFKPQDAPADWVESETWKSAQLIPGVECIVDINGAEAGHFGGQTSGDVRVFEPDGRRIYAGGITLSRGHAGDSPGARSVTALLTDGVPERTTSPTFGCELSVPPSIQR